MTFTDIKNRTYFFTKTNSGSFPDADLTLAVNRAIERVVSLIKKSDKKWQFDDSNYSDLPYATTAIVSGQQDYSLSTSHLTIERVELKLSGASQFTLLKPIDLQDKTGAWDATTTGTPIEYDKMGSTVLLLPVPNFSQDASLRLFYSRAPLQFSYVTGQFSDGTGSVASQPGFNSLFHDLLSLWASYDYKLSHSQDTNPTYNEILKKEQELQNFYGDKSRDERFRLSTYENNR